MTRSGKNNTRLAGAALAVAAAALATPALGQSGICPLTGNPPVPAAAPCNLEPIVPSTSAPDTRTIHAATWAYGPNTDLTEAQKTATYWNPVKTRMEAGLPVIGRRVSVAGPTTPGGYCSSAVYDQATNHFTWVDMIHSSLVYSQVWPMWPNAACPGLNFTTTAARGILLPLDEREAQHAADGGAILYIFPVNSEAEAKEAAFWTYYPPVGHHSAGGNQLGSVYTGNTLSPDAPGQISVNAAGGQRNSFNRNAVLIARIGSIEGAQQAAAIAAVEGLHALYLDEADLASRTTGSAQFNALANAVRAAAQASGKHLCTVSQAATPHTMTCVKL